MSKYGVQQGYQFEGDLRKAIQERAKYETRDISFCLLTEEMLKKKFGMCLSSAGLKIVGVDILCVINETIYAIQCKQYTGVVPKRCVQDFIDYCNFLEKHLGRKIIKIWSSSQESTKPGNALAKMNEFVWIVFPNTDALIINTVHWLFENKLHVDNDCDVLMI